MKKALVYYLYGTKNAGDMAICMGTIEFLKKHNYSITFVSRFSEAEDEFQRSKDYLAEYFPDVKVYPGPFSFERDFSVLKKLHAYTDSLFKVARIKADEMTKQLVATHDIVFFNGGNLLRGANGADYLRLLALFYPIKIAHKMGKPIYCLPQSTAQINCCGEKLLKKYLAYFEKIYVREKISYGELKKRFPQFDFTESTDMAFCCQNSQTATKKFYDLQISLTGKDIAVVVRNTGIGDIGYLSEEKKTCLHKEIASFMRKHGDYFYWIIVQTEKDREFSNALLDEFKGKVELIECHDPMLLREIYKHMTALVTMRLHAGILSLSAYTPVVGIFSEEWGLKNPGIMCDYEMPYVIIESNDNDSLELPNINQKEKIAQNIQEYIQSLECLFDMELDKCVFPVE